MNFKILFTLFSTVIAIFLFQNCDGVDSVVNGAKSNSGSFSNDFDLEKHNNNGGGYSGNNGESFVDTTSGVPATGDLTQENCIDCIEVLYLIDSNCTEELSSIKGISDNDWQDLLSEQEFTASRQLIQLPNQNKDLVASVSNSHSMIIDLCSFQLELVEKNKIENLPNANSYIYQDELYKKIADKSITVDQLPQ